MSFLRSTIVASQRRAERGKQFPVHRVLLRIAFGVPLHAERKAGRGGNADRLDGAVVHHALDDHSAAWNVDALTVQRVDADGLAAGMRQKQLQVPTKMSLAL